MIIIHNLAISSPFSTVSEIMQQFTLGYDSFFKPNKTCDSFDSDILRISGKITKKLLQILLLFLQS